MLGGFGLDFPCGGDIRHQRQVHQQCPAGAHFHAELTRRLQERQALDVAHRAADFDDGYVGIARTQNHPALDFIGDVRNDLHGATEIVTAALFLQHGVVDPSGGEVIRALHGRAGETLVVTQVQIGLGAVFGHKDFTVLERAHGARVNIDVGVELQQGDLDAARLEHRREGCRCNPFAQGRNHTTGDEDITRHAKPICTL